MNSPSSSSDDALPESVPESVSGASTPLPEPVYVPVGDETPPKYSSSPVSTPAPAPAPVAAGRSALAGWALLVALIALGAVGYALWQSNSWRTQAVSLREEVAARLRDSDALAKEARTLASTEQENLDTIKSRLAAMQAKMEVTEGQAAALESLYQQFSRSQEDRILAEVEHAMSIATQQLQLAGNIELALIALRGAQSRLEQYDRGQFVVLRRALAGDIDKLGQQSTFDVPATALRLELLLARVDTLPLAFAGEVPDADAPVPSDPTGTSLGDFARSLAHDLWSELRSLVKVDRLDGKVDPVLLAPEQRTFLRENLKIRLLTARLALLARDGRTYAADLAQARIWIERYFDVRDSEVKTAVEDLQTLEVVPVRAELFDLVDSVAALRRIQTQARVAPEVPLRPLPSRSEDPATPARTE
jgi:uroporphyrin-3 C-methyltransferase